MANNWTQENLSLLKELTSLGRTNKEISERLKEGGFFCSADAVGKKIAREGLKRAAETTWRSVHEIADESRQRKRESVLQRERSELTDRVIELEAEREAWFAMQAFTSTHKIQQLEHRKVSATAVLDLSDAHCEEEVKPEGVTHLNEYNLEVAENRLTNYFNNAIGLLEIYSKDVFLDGVVLNILGDLITGNIHEENLENCLLEPTDAILWVQDHLIPGIEMIDAWRKTKNLPFTIVCKVGNHSRITKKRHISTEEGNALEWMLYHTLKRIFPGINWIIDRAYHTYLNIYQKCIRIHHGTAVQYSGGIGGPLIPIAKAVSAWDKAIKADLNIQGHLHQEMSAHNTIVNGSVIGYNRFAVEIKAQYEDPKQSAFLYTNKGDVVMKCPIFVRDLTNY